MIYIYVLEMKYYPIALIVKQVLAENKIRVLLVNKTHNFLPSSLYLLVGSEYMIQYPQRYIIIQTVPTSPKTLVNKIDAFWMDKQYLEVLKKAIAIWDISSENIRVWKQYYKLEHVYLLDLVFTNNIKNYFINNNVSIDRRDYNNYSEIIVYGINGKHIVDKYKKIKITNQKITNSFNILEIVNRNKVLPIFVGDYKNTYPDIVTIIILRYYQIPVIVEKCNCPFLDKLLVNLGCFIFPYTRILLNLPNIIKSVTSKIINNSYNSKINKTIPIINTELLSIFQKYMEVFRIKTNKKEVFKPNKLFLRRDIQDVKFNILEDGGITLKLSDISDDILPNISICTPTGNRRLLFSLAIKNFNSFKYPYNKIEWVILDDGHESIGDIIPKDNRIKYTYLNLEKRLSIGEKRNQLVKLASHDIIVFMDDDDYYTPESLLARVKCLLKYQSKGIQCIGCKEVAMYDLINNYAAITSNGNEYLTESSLTFYRSFWNNRPFQATDKSSEYRYFLEYRQNQLLNIPFQFVTIALTHKSNTTGSVRKLDFYKQNNDNYDWKETQNKIMEMLDDETQAFLSYLSKKL